MPRRKRTTTRFLKIRLCCIRPRRLDGRLLEGGNIFWLTIFKGAKNVDLAKELILDMIDPANFLPVSKLGGGLNMPSLQESVDG